MMESYVTSILNWGALRRGQNLQYAVYERGTPRMPDCTGFILVPDTIFLFPTLYSCFRHFIYSQMQRKSRKVQCESKKNEMQCC